MIVTLIPRNPIQAFAEGNILQIIVYGAFFGIACNLVGAKAKPVLDVFDAIANVMFKMSSLVMKVTPVGVFALMAWATGSFGLDVLLPVMKFLLSYYAAAGIFMLIVFCGILIFMARLSPLPFFRGMTEAIATAASTCSSSASLPANIQCATNNLGISKGLANFVLPLGCSLNMNGSALFQAMSALFIAQAYGIELQMQHLVVIATTVILATIGTASIPGAGLLMLSIVFSSVGIPLEGIAILASIDRLRDMVTTILNITGDAVCAVYIAKREGELDEAIYSAKPQLAEQTL
jgi:dicarboxylate/amino acid:cation (Na+ or H+) symporter, DAACS family